MSEVQKFSRKEQILQELAKMLEVPNQKITTAGLANACGVSEAALYRHYPSKARMFEGLIDFIDETLFSRINQISQANVSSVRKVEQIFTLILAFTEKNPGISRILSGEALTGENDRLRIQVNKLYERLETQIKQIMRQAELTEGIRTDLPVGTTASLILSIAEGRIRQYVRTDFKKKPTEFWPEQWARIANGLFRKVG